MTATVAPPAYAGIVSRAVAFVIDALLINAGMLLLAGCASLVLSVLLPDVDLGLGAVLAGAGVWGLAGAAYFMAFWTLTGQTAGMRVMRLAVVDATGARPHVGRAAVRLVGMWLAAVPLFAGYALILFDGRRQGLHDKLARTFVTYAR